ncbi:MAG: D-alanine--D-alanine ligase [Pirellulales bacterium]
MRVTILSFIEREDDQRLDPVVEQVAGALRASGHEPALLSVHGDVEKLVSGLRDSAPGLVFNLMEMFGQNLLGDVGVTGLLELLELPYTGCGPGESYLQQDKALAKKLLAFDQIRYPDFAVFAADSTLETGGNLRLPLFVKPLRADASIGIDGGSLVHTATDLMKRVVQIHEELHDSALAEEYIEGREFYVGVLGNQEPTPFPPIEMDFSRLDAEKPRIADSKAKWEKGTPEYEGTRSVLADVSPELLAKLQQAALAAYRALRVRDYGRVDFRVTDSGEIYVIEVNASCYLERSSEFATAARAAGIKYNDLIERIVQLALERHDKQLSNVTLK